MLYFCAFNTFFCLYHFIFYLFCGLAIDHSVLLFHCLSFLALFLTICYFLCQFCWFEITYIFILTFCLCCLPWLFWLYLCFVYFLLCFRLKFASLWYIFLNLIFSLILDCRDIFFFEHKLLPYSKTSRFLGTFGSVD